MRHVAVAFDLLRWAATRDSAIPARVRPFLRDAAGMNFLRSRGIDSLLYIATGDPSGWQYGCDAVFRAQVDALKEILYEFRRAGIRALTFKGCELINRYFSGRALGLVADADVLIPRFQVEEARRILYGAGFRHATYDSEAGALRDRDVAEVAAMEVNHYELAPFSRLMQLDADPGLDEIAQGEGTRPFHSIAGRPHVVIEIDLHHNVAIDAEAEMLFERAVDSGLGVCETLSAADHVWLNLSRYYNEVALHDKTSLRPIAYTLPVITHEQVDWSVVEKVIEELELGPTLYYFLALCAYLAPGRVPDGLIDRINPRRNSRIRDWGWQMGKLFDFVEPFPEPTGCAVEASA